MKNKETNKPGLLAEFYDTWKPEFKDMGSAAIVVGGAMLSGFAAYWYTMGFNAWVCFLAVMVATVLGGSITMALAKVINRRIAERRADKDNRVTARAEVVHPTAAPAAT